jgi:Na+-transporting NADH:ubiquinone oxidoreductase subunit A
MVVHRSKKGLDLPVAGVPDPSQAEHKPVRRVALLGADFVGAKPRPRVQEGDRVRRGELIFEDAKNPGVLFVAPGGGRVAAVHRGAKRALQSVVIELDEDEDDAKRTFDTFANGAADRDADSVRALLIESGLWTTLRTRPYSRVPIPGAKPRSIFVTATDTNPLAVDPAVALEGREDDLVRGLAVLKKLTDGPVRLCRRAGSAIEPGDSGATVEEFRGPHPSGTVGYHIHVLDPVYRGKEVWHLTYADVVRIGRTFATGVLDVDRVVALGGPVVKTPRLLKTRVGASIDELVEGELEGDDLRVISGSVLSGRRARGEVHGYLGAYHLQISALAEGRERELLGWLRPGLNKFSALPVFVSKLMGSKPFAFTTTTNGSRRAMVPIGAYERVVPMDLMPTHLLRALCIKDLEWAEELGVLELDEEDLSLCTFVDPGKTDFAVYLRDVLDQIHAEG